MERSLLCVNCGLPPPVGRRTWDRCKVCVARQLPTTYYCGQQCMNLHWPKHKVWHKTQKEMARDIAEGDDDLSSMAEEESRRAAQTGDKADELYADALHMMNEGDYHGAVKAWRKLIQMRPWEPSMYHNLGVVLLRTACPAEAGPTFLKGMEVSESMGMSGSELWAKLASGAFDMLKHPDSRVVPKPEWWNDEGLKALSARVVAVVPDDSSACTMRAYVLCGDAFCEAPWNAGSRTAAEIKEAAKWFRRAVAVAHVPATKVSYEVCASRCDKVADPLLAEQEAKAVKARAAAEIEEAAARKVAETKANTAAEELLADEENEKKKKEKAASTKAGKAKQGKGKKGNGKR